MGRISSSIGLITGTQIDSTVDQLISLSAIPRDRLQNRTEALKREQAAVTELTVLTIGLQLSARQFGGESAFNGTAVGSTNTEALSATKSGTPAVGEYQIRTLQTAGTQAFRSRSFNSASTPFGSAGTLTVRGGGFVDRSARLEDLNGGRGVAAGSIRIGDRAGNSAVIDLSDAITVDDVLRKINEQSDISVRASTDGDAIRLSDQSGGAGELTVDSVGGTTTAVDLGLAGIRVASDTAEGADILRLSSDVSLSELRDGRGLGFANGDDMTVTLRDGSELSVDFGDFSREAGQASGSTSSVVENAGLTFTAVETGADADGVEVRFVNDPDVTAGNETVRWLEGAGGRTLLFGIEEGVSTAADIEAALAGNSELGGRFTATFDGDGSGVVSESDAATLSGGAAIEASGNPQLGDMLRVLNEVDPTKLRAELAPGGDRIQLVDLTEGDESFSVSNAGTSTVASELGLVSSTTSDTIQGQRLQSGLSTVSLNTLRGGQGLTDLSTLDITTADGATAAVDVSSAETLKDVINAINDSGLAVEASVNRAGSGLAIRDLSAGDASSFSVSSADDTASLLGIDSSTTDVLITGSSLDAQFVSRGTRLDDLNRGEGVNRGSMRFTDSNGGTGIVSMAGAEVETIGQLIDEINGLGIAIEASINETGDGVRLIDTGSGGVAFKVEDLGLGTAAADLGLKGTATGELLDGELVSTINGRQADVFEIRSDDTASSVVERIRQEGRFATASLMSDPSGGASVSLRSLRGGSAGRMTVETSGIDLGFQQSAVGRDAVISIGDDGSTASLVRSSDGVFDNAIEGLTLTAKEVTSEPVTISVETDHSLLESAVERFVNQYNSLTEKIGEVTFYDPNTQTSGVLFGRGEIINMESAVTNLINSRLPGLGSVRSAVDLGFSIDGQGKLSFDKTTFRSQMESNAEDVERFLTHEERGLVPKLDGLIERYAGADGGVLLNRTTTINSKIEANNQRIETMNVRLERERNRLLNQFYKMEESIAKLQSSQQYLSSIQSVAIQ